MTDATARPPSSPYMPRPYPRYVWRPDDRTDRRILCKCKTRFAPDTILRNGSAVAIHRPCGQWLLILGGACGIVVVETSAVELAWMRSQGFDALAELVYAEDNPVRTGSGSV